MEYHKSQEIRVQETKEASSYKWNPLLAELTAVQNKLWENASFSEVLIEIAKTKKSDEVNQIISKAA